MITENINNVRDGFIRSEPAKSGTEAPLMQPFPAATVKQKETYDESLSWHNGYRAACKDICERCGLDNTDEIELLVKERDALKANNEWMDKEFVRLNGELQAAQKDQELFRVFAEDVNDLRVAAHIKDLEIARLERNIASSDADAEKVGKIVRDQHQEITRLAAENAELRKDAERWRRSTKVGFPILFQTGWQAPMSDGSLLKKKYPGFNSAEEAIDAAMGKEQS